ncbi:hypothetical protein [Streptomyces zagrosensis]|uniref:Uncharacterized protein n=1 Tax=Streptomyces zagrosensis TaxID=1042984 RepID=A0A7W9QHN7_9ACTN|nr:hypothetical protein [Streptomyces zagrosensis]MBB5939432.1 hypothetical protein [Streptomyces zagrosensis]
MGSLRNPIGPLPSSIYWRRRAVALSLAALLFVLVIWAVSLGGGDGGGKDNAKGNSGGNATTTITPGPSASTPVNSQRPGGRDESEEGDDSGGSGGDAGSSGSNNAGGTGGTGGSGGNAGSSSGGSGGSGTTGATGGLGIGDGALEPSDSTLGDCEAGAVELTLRSVKNSYEPGEKPEFELIAKNSGDGACKLDLGRASAALTITDAADDHVWASDDCPRGSAVSLVRVPGDGKIKRMVEWDRKVTQSNCASPSGTESAKAGTYLVEAKVEGLGTARVSFVLAKD